MDREEQTCVGLVGDIDTCLQVACLVGTPMLVRGAGVDHIHLGHILLDHTSHFECNAECNITFAVLLTVECSDCTGVIATVSWVDDDCHRLAILSKNVSSAQQSGDPNR